MDTSNGSLFSLKETFRTVATAGGRQPDPSHVGEFVLPSAGPSVSDNGQGFLAPWNWVYHAAVVDLVLAGNYDAILPYTAEFVGTLNCLYRCALPCSYVAVKVALGIWGAERRGDPAVEMQDIQLARDLIARLCDAGVKSLIFTGGGEPFSWPWLEESVECAVEHGLDTAVYTNGGPEATRPRVDRLIAVSPKLVRVSLNCGSDEVYRRFHRANDSGAFTHVLGTIAQLAAGSVRNPRMVVGVSVAFNRQNSGNELVESAQRVVDIVQKEGGGISFMSYRPAFNFNSSKQLQTEFLERQFALIEERVRPNLESAGVKCSNVRERYEHLIAVNNHVSVERPYHTCRASGLYGELGQNGELHLCCDRNCDPKWSIGDLKEFSVEEIWNSEQRKQVLAEVNRTGTRDCPAGCKPHATNIQFEAVEKFRREGQLYKVEVWIEEMRKTKPPPMVNF